MSATSIEWTDRSWNPTSGCTKVSQGCKHCYAEVMAKRTFGRLYPQVPADPLPDHVSKAVSIEYGDELAHALTEAAGMRARRFTDVQVHADRLERPLRWRKPCRVFVNSMSDLFHEDVPDEFIDRVFAVMALCPQHTFQVLTKRPARMRAYLTEIRRQGVIDAGEKMKPSRPPAHWYYVSDWSMRTCPWPLRNVWLGVSVEDQATADERIPLLLQTPAALRFVSYEPALGPVDFTSIDWFGGALKHRVDVLRRGYWCAEGWIGLGPAAQLGEPRGGFTNHSDMAGLDWLIVGGESGPKARRCDVAWIRSVVAHCKAAEVPVFVKQLGANVIDRNDAGFTGDFDGSGRAWPEQHAIDDRIEQDIDGTRDGYQGAAVRIHCRDRKGADPAEWPKVLRVRQWPEVSWAE